MRKISVYAIWVFLGGVSAWASDFSTEAPDFIPARQRSSVSSNNRSPASLGTSPSEKYYPGIIVETYDPKTYRYLNSQASRSPASLGAVTYGDAPEYISRRSR